MYHLDCHYTRRFSARNHAHVYLRNAPLHKIKVDVSNEYPSHGIKPLILLIKQNETVVSSN